MGSLLTAFGLTLLAGLATGVGSVIAFAASRTNYRFLSVSTGFSAGVMLYVSFVEILVKGSSALADAYGARAGAWVNAASFFGGMALIALIDNLIPSSGNPHETRKESETLPLRDGTADPAGGPVAAGAAAAPGGRDGAGPDRKLLRMGLFTALAIGLHNFPEGLATFLSALHDPALGVAIAAAVALHNIPEGISVSVPIYYATGNRRKAFVYSVLSGLAEPVGAGLAFLAIMLFTGKADGLVPPSLMGVLFGGVAGIMVYISLDELLPTSRAYGKGHDSLLGLVAGMVVMALSLLMMK